MNNYKNYKLEDLGCWKKARFFRKEIYKTAIQFLPDGYKLKHQMIGAAGSIGHNIAEGFGRGNFQENIQHCRISRGSTIEVRDQLYAALDYGFISQDKFDYLHNLNIELEKSINSHIGYLKNRMKEQNKKVVIN